jgi:hypothetical protein
MEFILYPTSDHSSPNHPLFYPHKISRVPSIILYPKPDQSSPNHPILFLQDQ